MSKYVFQQLPPSNSEKKKNRHYIIFRKVVFFMVEVKDRNSRGFYGGLEFKFSVQVNQTY